jgi:uncharacterized protein YcgI (DUF1989 family)
MPALDPGEPDGLNHTRHDIIAPGGVPTLDHLYRIPPRQGRAVRLAKGQTVSVINSHGTQVCDLWAFSAADRREFLSMEHVRAALSRIKLEVGDRLVTNRRRPILAVVEDTSPGVHDTCIAACDLPRYQLLGCTDYHDNCTDNLKMALLAIDERAPEVPSPLNLWMNTPIRPDGSIAWLPPVAKPGDKVCLRAEMDAIVVMSACPQDIVPINGVNCVPTELHFVVHGA